MRKYQETHPWISFSLNLEKASHKFWMLLGEIQSKCGHIAGVPLKKSVADELHQLYLAKGVLGTAAIEGNTLSEEEVLKRINEQLQLPLSKEYLGQEIDNITGACNDILNGMLKGETGELDPNTLKRFNCQVLNSLPEAEEKEPGKVRQSSVGVGHYRGAPPEDCEYLIERLCEWLNRERASAPEHSKIAFGVIRAVFAHLYLAWIHPFNDGNGRTARLTELQILLDVGVPTPAAHLLSNHYNLTRTEYYRQLDRTSQSKGDVFPFMEYALQGFLDGLKEQLAVIRGYQWDVIWRDFVYETFKKQKSKISSRVIARRRELVLAFKLKPVPINEIRSLSTELAESYAQKTTKTIVRDLNALVDMGLVEHSTEGVRAKKEIILAFLPTRLDRS